MSERLRESAALIVIAVALAVLAVLASRAGTYGMVPAMHGTVEPAPVPEGET